LDDRAGDEDRLWRWVLVQGAPEGSRYGDLPCRDREGSGRPRELAGVVVRMLRWSYLADQYIQAPTGGEMTTNPIAVHGVTYQHPLALDAGCYNPWNGDAWINYPLKGQYETFTATVGIGDTADSATVASFAVLTDGKQVAGSNLVYGQAVKLSLPLAGVKRLQLRINVPDPTGAAGCSAFFPKVVFGDAQGLGP
jgi:hypothetical protein